MDFCRVCMLTPVRYLVVDAGYRSDRMYKHRFDIGLKTPKCVLYIFGQSWYCFFQALFGIC